MTETKDKVYFERRFLELGEFNSKVLGIDVGGQNIKAGWVRKGEISNFRRIPIKPRNVISEILKTISEYKPSPETIIGVDIPGFVSSGKVYNSPNLPTIKEINIQELLKKETGCPVYVLNDANACILGEALYGAGRGYSVVVGFTLGTGVGGALVVNGKIWAGARGYASEFGHHTIDPTGPICHCGKRGCLESYIGAYALMSRYKSLSGEDITVEELFKRASRNEPHALKVVNEFGFYLGIGIRNIIAILDPDLVVLAGGISKSGNLIIQSLQRNKPFVHLFPEEIEIKIAELGDQAGPVGAATWAWMEHN